MPPTCKGTFYSLVFRIASAYKARMPKGIYPRKKLLRGKAVFTGAWFGKDERDWLVARSRAGGNLTISAILRMTVARARTAGWTFGNEVPTPDAARNGEAV